MFGLVIFIGIFSFFIFFIIYHFHSVAEIHKPNNETGENVFTKELEQRREQVKKELLKEFRISYVNNIISIVKEYEEVLILKRTQGCYKNEWGEIVVDDYLKDLDYFILRIIPLKYDYTQAFEYQRLEEFDMSENEIFAFDLVLSEDKPAEYEGFDGKKIKVKFGFNIKDVDITGHYISTTEYIIDTYLSKIAWMNSIVNPKKQKKENNINTPLDYEQYIVVKLKDLGFNAHATKGSGDQGADVLADRNGIKFAIQCKMYSNPVGNKAVQEVNAARDYYDCDYAVVVTNSTYTKSARAVANTCNVILLHETELDKLLKLTEKE